MHFIVNFGDGPDQRFPVGLELPDEEFDYDKFVKEEFDTRQPKPRGIGWFWWLVALLAAILVSFVLLSGMLGL